MRAALLGLVLLGAVLAGACGGAEEPAATPRGGQAEGGATKPPDQDAGISADAAVLTPPASELDGREFVLVSAEGFEAVAGRPVRISFEGDRLHTDSGCNSLNGSYHMEEGHLVLDRWGTTSIGCFGQLGVQDNWYEMFLRARPLLSVAGDELELRGDDAILHFLDREVADPDRSLVDTLWSVNSFIEGGGVTGGGTGASMRPATLRFGADGKVVVDTTCNQGQGRYLVDGDRVTLSELAYTEEGCALPLLEDKLQAVLSDGVLQFEIKARQLKLTRGAIGLNLLAP